MLEVPLFVVLDNAPPAIVKLPETAPTAPIRPKLAPPVIGANNPPTIPMAAPVAFRILDVLFSSEVLLDSL